MKDRTKRAAYLLRRPDCFAQAGDVVLRPYQELAIRAVVNSVRRQRGFSFVWIFPRQSGKDEALAILVQYLLTLFKNVGGEMVFFNPTFKPQTETSMRRLESRLKSNIFTIGRWKRRSGYIYQINNACCTYLSADPTAHVVSATANRLLVVNEAQDVGVHKYDKDIDPMAASGNTTKVFSGHAGQATPFWNASTSRRWKPRRKTGSDGYFYLPRRTSGWSFRSTASTWRRRWPGWAGSIHW